MSHHPPRSLPILGMGLILVATLLAACGGATPSTPTDGSPDPSTAAEPRPVIIDADLDISDIAAIAVLLRDPAIDVRAIAVEGTGLVHCEGGLAATRYLLAELDAPDIPYGCGREIGGQGARPFPAAWRAVADAAYGLDVGSVPAVETPDAVDIITTAIEESPSPPTIVALGPLTNLQDAFEADASLPGRIAGIHAMLGAIDAPGNVMVDNWGADDRLEWNAFADPAAVAAVFATDVPISLVPLDATDDVPVPADLRERLEAQVGAGANLVYEGIVRHPERLAADQGQQLWDELAALVVSDPDLVTWSEAKVAAGPRGGLTRDEASGRPIRYAASADAPAVEDALIAALGRGAPRVKPFSFAGTLTAAFDGTTCTLSAPAAEPGLYRLTYTGIAGTPNGVFVAGVAAPHTWADLQAFVASIDVSSDSGSPTPDWIVPGAEAFDDDGSGGPITSTIEVSAGAVGPICLLGDWPDMRFVVGEPLLVEG